MAFEGLLTWARAVVMQRDRLAGLTKLTNTRMAEFAEALKTKRARAEDNPSRALKHVFEADRLFFCIAAAKFFEYRKWVVELKLLEPKLFEEVNKFDTDAKAMRDLNEHA